MKKTTKRIVSAILSASMLLTSVFVNPVYAAETSTASAVTAYAENTVSVVFADAVAGLADGTAKKYDKGTTLVADPEITVYGGKGSFTGYAVKAINATFNDGAKEYKKPESGNNAIQVGNGNEAITPDSVTEGADLVDFVEKGLSIKVDSAAEITVWGALSTADVPSAKFALADIDETSDKYLTVVSVGEATRPDTSATVYNVPTLKVPKAGTYAFFIPGKVSGCNVFQIDITPTADSEETTVAEETTEATTAAEETTEATTEAVTEAATEATTEAETQGSEPVVGTENLLSGLTADFNAGDTVASNNDIEIKVAKSQEGGLAYTPDDPAIDKFDGKTYPYHYQTGGTNTEKTKLDGANDGTFREAFEITPKVDGTLVIDAKVNKGKAAAIVTGAPDATGYTSVNAETGTKINTDADGYFTLTADLKAGTTYLFVGKGTNVPVYGVYYSTGDAPVVEPTTVEATTEATTEAATEATTAAAPAVEKGDINIYIGQASAPAVEDKVEPTNATEIKVPFYLENRKEGYNNFTFFVNFDNKVLEATGLELGDAIKDEPGLQDISFEASNFDIEANNTDYTGLSGKAAASGKLKFAAFSKNPETNYLALKSGELFTITFKVLDAKAGTLVDGKGYASGISIDIVQDGFRDELGSVNRPINTKVFNTVYFEAKEETTEATTEATTAEATTSAEGTTEATTAAGEETTEATTAAEATTSASEVTTQAAEATTATETATETTTTASRSSSSSSGGGGGSSSRRATVTTKSTDVEDETETTTKAQSSGSQGSGEGSFTVTGKNGQSVVIVPPTETKDVDDFVDVPKSHWAYGSVMKLAELGIVNGVGDDRFAPADPCKRADFVIMINNTLGIKGTAKFNFSDVAANKYYYNPVGVAYEIGIASGYGDDTFKPENYCTREEMMVLVAKTFEFLGETVTTADQSSLDRFADAESISWWAKPYTAYLVEEGMVAGTGANFEPQVYMNRASLAVLMAQVYDKVVAMAAEKGTSVEEVVEEIVEEEKADEAVTAADVVAAAKELEEVKASIEKDFLDKISSDVKDNFESRSAEFDQLIKKISDDMSDEDAQKAMVELKEYDELFSDIIDAAADEK